MRRIALLGSLVFFAATPSALASVVLAPPGHDGANQYVEVIPTSGGNAVPPGSVRGSGRATAPPTALSGLGHGSSADASLAKMGKDGQAAAALAAATAPSPAANPTGGSASHAGAPGATRVAASSSGGSAIDGITNALSGSGGGLGLLLPLLLATALLVVVGFTGQRVLSARHHQQPGG